VKLTLGQTIKNGRKTINFFEEIQLDELKGLFDASLNFVRESA
jgi:hypothetical protein